MSDNISNRTLGEIKNLNALTCKERVKVQLEQGDITQAQALVIIAEKNAEFFISENEEVYATINIHEVIENVLVKSEKFKRMLRMYFYEIFNKPISSGPIGDAVETIIANAEFNYTSFQKTYLRVGKNKDATKIYIDLANKNRDIVEIDDKGWRLITEAPVKFRRPRTLEPLPIPKRGGNVQDIEKYLNIKEEDKILLYSFLISCLTPSAPYPILILQGQHGSGKSFLSRLIKSIVDPTFAPIRALPRNEENLIVSANSTRLMAFDNISGLSNRMSDALCKLSTGGGYTTRKFYENTDEVVISTTRPIILNGIDYIARRPDLADRSIIINLKPIRDQKRKSEAELIEEIKIIKPRILGALFTVMSEAIKNYRKVKVESTPRMADFAKWATAAETALGYNSGEFLKAYKANLREAALESVEHDLIISTIIECLEKRKKVVGNATTLLRILEDYVPYQFRNTDHWIKAPNQLKDELTRIVPILEEHNIEYKYQRTSTNRIHTLEKL